MGSGSPAQDASFGHTQALLPTQAPFGCQGNQALAERVNGILKQEFLVSRCRNFEELKRVIAESARF